MPDSMHYGQILDTAPCGFLSFTDSGTIVDINTTLLGMLGYDDKQQVEGNHMHLLLTTAGRIFYSTHFFPLLKLHGEAKEIFFNLRRQDEILLPVVCNAARRTDNVTGIYDCVFTGATERTKFEEEILKAKRAAELALSENTELIAMRNQLKDMNVDADRYIRQLLHFNEELAEVSKIVTHDLQEPLRKIGTWADRTVIKNRNTLAPDVTAHLEKVSVECVKLRGLARRLDDYMQIDTNAAHEPSIDLNEIAWLALGKVITDNGGCQVQFASDDLPRIDGNRALLSLLFANLFDNSVKYGLKTEPVEINIQYTEIEQNSVINVSGTYSYTKHAQLIISDNGNDTGSISKERPFRIYKKDFASSLRLGFGLAFCKKIVEVHRGTITLTADPGKGLIVKIALPLERAS